MGEAGLAQLAVVDHVDAEIDLLPDDLLDGLARPRGRRPLLRQPSRRPRLEHRENVRGARKTPGMRGEDPVGAPPHGRLALDARAPDPLGGRRHVDAPGSGRAQRVVDRVHDRRRRPSGRVLPRSLHAEGVVGLRQLVELHRDGREIVGTRNRVVHEARGQGLPAHGVEDDVLHQRLSDPLRGTAVHLAVDDQGIDGPSHVGDDQVPLEPHGAVVRIDRHLGDVATVGVHVACRDEVGLGDEPPARAFRRRGDRKSLTPRSVPATV